MAKYRKHYTCSQCGTQWHDEWDCLCNDRCPECNTEIEPDAWEELPDDNGNFPDKAIKACQILVDAYKRGEESHEVNWEEVDDAHAMALEALGQAGD